MARPVTALSALTLSHAAAWAIARRSPDRHRGRRPASLSGNLVRLVLPAGLWSV